MGSSLVGVLRAKAAMDALSQSTPGSRHARKPTVLQGEAARSLPSPLFPLFGVFKIDFGLRPRMSGSSLSYVSIRAALETDVLDTTPSPLSFLSSSKRSGDSPTSISTGGVTWILCACSAAVTRPEPAEMGCGDSERIWP